MPELLAQIGGPEVVFAQYQFSEARRPQWEEFWRAHDGDLREIYGVAQDTMKLAHPEQFVAALHRFLFYTYPGNTWLQRQAIRVSAQDQSTFDQALNNRTPAYPPRSVPAQPQVRPCPTCGSVERFDNGYGSMECARCGNPTPDLASPDPAEVYMGASVKITSAKPKNFLAFLRSIADTHDKEPMSRGWYARYGTTPMRYIDLLRLADVTENDEDDDEYLMRRVNARIPDLGFQLYESYLLLKAPKAKATEERVLQTLEKIGQEIDRAISS